MNDHPWTDACSIPAIEGWRSLIDRTFFASTYTAMCTIGLRYAQRNKGRNLHRVLDDRTKTLLRQVTEAGLNKLQDPSFKAQASSNAIPPTCGT
jgi:hypothetical protein